MEAVVMTMIDAVVVDDTMIADTTTGDTTIADTKRAQWRFGFDGWTAPSEFDLSYQRRFSELYFSSTYMSTFPTSKNENHQDAILSDHPCKTMATA
jgi:hypothetical protein